MKASALVQIITVCLSSIDFVNGGPVRVPSAGNSNIPSIDNPYSLPRRDLRMPVLYASSIGHKTLSHPYFCTLVVSNPDIGLQVRVVPDGGPGERLSSSHTGKTSSDTVLLNDHKRATSPPPKPADVTLAEKLALLNRQLRNEVTDKRDPGLSPDPDDLKLAIGAYTIEAQIWGNIDPQKTKVQGNSKELLMAALQQFDRQTWSILKSWEGLKDEKDLDPDLKEAIEKLVIMIHGLKNFKAKEEGGESSGPSV